MNWGAFTGRKGMICIRMGWGGIELIFKLKNTVLLMAFFDVIILVEIE